MDRKERRQLIQELVTQQRINTQHDLLAMLAEHGIDVGEVYENLKTKKLWRDINDCLPLILDSGVDAFRVYEELKAEDRWWCIAGNLNSFADHGISATEVYECLKKDDRWEQVTKNFAAFMDNGVTVNAIEVYDHLKEDGTWGAWSSISEFLEMSVERGLNLAEIYEKFTIKGWWEEIAYSLPSFMKSGVNVDVIKVYDYLKSKDWWKTMIQGLPTFFENGISAVTIYEGLKKKESWGWSNIIDNLELMFDNGLNPAFYILDADGFQLLRSVPAIRKSCDTSEILAAFKLREKGVNDDENFFLALKAGFTLNEILRYPFLCSPLLKKRKSTLFGLR